MPPQVVVFDLGKVLLHFDYTRAARALAARGTASVETINQLINQSPLLYRFEQGAMTNAEFFNEVRAATGFKGDFEEFSQVFGDIFTEMPAMIGLHAALKKKGVPTYIFSNTNGIQVPFIRRTFPFFSGFDGYIFSYEHGAIKPEPKIYEAIERETKHRGEQILYIDDRPENVAAGAARGWRVILQETPEKSLAEFRKAGFTI